MRLCTVYTKDLDPFFGVELKHKILRVAPAARAFELPEKEAAGLATTMAYFQNLPASEKALRNLLKAISEDPKKLARPADDGNPFLIDSKDVSYATPIERPGKFLCIGLNYRDHCEEQNRPIPEKPLVFNKFNTSLIPHGAPIPLPAKKYEKNVDYEGEFAIVIGKKARRVTKKTAMKSVGGYTIVNDVSARTIQKAEKQWARAKGFDGSGPWGPVIVTPDEIPDPHTIGISTRLNGQLMQNSNTKNLIFGVDDLISFISQVITLEPGDVIATGTPGGVGVFRDPPVFLEEGDTVEIRIDRIGVLKNPVAKG